jgi:hypothetical protein
MFSTTLSLWKSTQPLFKKKMMMNEQIKLTKPELSSLLEESAEQGAKKALASIGLHDENASKDVLDLRTLLDSFRAAKRTVLQTVVRVLTIGVLAAIAGWWFGDRF